MSGASSGHISPCALYQSQLQGNSCHLKRRPWLRAGGLEHAHAFGDHFAADAVPGNDRDGMFFHGCAVYRIAGMRFAAIETSTQWCSVALWSDGEIAVARARAGQRHSELVLPMLERLWRKTWTSRLDARRLRRRAGLVHRPAHRLRPRAGPRAARAALPVLGVSTLEALAEESGARARRRLHRCAHARSVLCGARERAAARWREVIPAQCVAPQRRRGRRARAGCGCGNGFAAYGESGLVARMLPEVHPTAAAVARARRAAPRGRRGRRCGARRAAVPARQGRADQGGAGGTMSAVLKDVPVARADARAGPRRGAGDRERRSTRIPWTRGNFADSLRAGYECRTLRLGARADRLLRAAWRRRARRICSISRSRRAHQRQRPRRALLREAMPLARGLDARSLFLEVRPSNRAAQALYTRFGFRKVARAPRLLPGALRPRGRAGADAAAAMSRARGDPRRDGPRADLAPAQEESS